MSQPKIVDLQKLNPNWEMAADHGQSTKPGLQPADFHKRPSIVMCPCCLNMIQKEPVNLWENSKELSFLGYGFPLFYNMLQFCLINLFILILTQSSILMYMALNETCDEKTHSRALAGSGVPYKCTAPFVIISRVQTHTSDIDVLIRILSFVGQLFLLIYFRDSQKKLAAYHIERNVKIKDFAVIFKNLPKSKGIQKSIKEFLEKEFRPRVHIQRVIMFPKIDEFLEKEKEKANIVDKKKKLLKYEKDPEYQDLISNIDKEIERINGEMMEICMQIEDKSEKDILYGEKAIVILSTEKEKYQVIDQFQKLDKKVLVKYFHWMGDQITMKGAPDPRQIIWENFNHPKNERWLKVLLGWALSILFLGSVTVIFYFLIRAKGQRLDQDLHQDGYTDQEYEEAVAIVFVSIILIQFFNKFLMKYVLHAICDLEKPETTSQLQFSYAFKYTLGMFFTTAVMTLAVEALEFNNYDGQYGVVEEETIMFLFSAFFVNMLWIVHPQYYIRKINRYMKVGREDLTQKEANILMEDYPYDIGKRFAEVLQIMWFTYLYSSLIPIGAPISFIGFAIYYWVDKYNLLRRSSITNTIESKLPLSAIKLMEMTIFYKPLGELIFDYQLRGGQVLPSTIVMLCVAVIYLFIPWNPILTAVFDEKFNIKQVQFSEIEQTLGNMYKLMDPVQRYIEIDKQLNQMKGKNMKFQLGRYQENPSGQTSMQEINLIVDNSNEES